jgi:hypothetical protein
LVSPKYRRIRSGPEIDKDRIVLSFSFVIFLELGSKAARLGAHDRVLARMIRWFAVIDLHAYQVFLQGIALAGDRRVNRKTKKPRKTVGIDEERTLQDAS